MLNNLKERIALILIITILFPFFILGIMILLVYILFFGKNWVLRQSFRAVDNFINVTLFGGYAWETLSSHAWRERETKFWAPTVIFLADAFHKGHCYKANLREELVIEVVKKNYLDEQTIRF